jgi:hypothetical protein
LAQAFPLCSIRVVFDSHVTSERCSGCERELALCSKLLLRSGAELTEAAHAMAVRIFAPIALVGCISELLDEAALCELAAPNEAH